MKRDDIEMHLMKAGLLALYIGSIWFFWTYAPNETWKPWIGCAWVFALGAWLR
jgi:hypothetical protein